MANTTYSKLKPGDAFSYKRGKLAETCIKIDDNLSVAIEVTDKKRQRPKLSPKTRVTRVNLPKFLLNEVNFWCGLGVERGILAAHDAVVSIRAA